MYKLLEQMCRSSNRERRALVLDSLSDLGISPIVHKFSHGGEQYVNIFALYGQKNGKPIRAVSSHYDKIESGEGALDNGSAVVESLGALKYLIQNDTPTKFGFVFFDGEEARCIGSKRFVRDRPVNLSQVYNLEVTGRGSCILVGKSSFGDFKKEPCWREPINNDARMNNHIKSICDSMGIQYFESRTPPCDNYYLNKAGIPSTVIVTVSQQAGKIWQEDGEPTARVMPLLGIHGKDSIDEVDKRTLSLMKKVIFKIATS